MKILCVGVKNQHVCFIIFQKLLMGPLLVCSEFGSRLLNVNSIVLIYIKNRKETYFCQLVSILCYSVVHGIDHVNDPSFQLLMLYFILHFVNYNQVAGVQ